MSRGSEPILSYQDLSYQISIYSLFSQDGTPVGTTVDLKWLGEGKDGDPRMLFEVLSRTNNFVAYLSDALPPGVLGMRRYPGIAELLLPSVGLNVAPPGAQAVEPSRRLQAPPTHSGADSSRGAPSGGSACACPPRRS